MIGYMNAKLGTDNKLPDIIATMNVMS